MPNKIATIAAAMSAAMIAAAPASAAGVKVGTLTCDVEAGWGYVLGSQKDLNCAFKSATNGTVAKYTGDVTKLGIDVGYTNAGVMIWTVVAPSKDMKPDALEGSYGGDGWRDCSRRRQPECLGWRPRQVDHAPAAERRRQ